MAAAALGNQLQLLQGVHTHQEPISGHGKLTRRHLELSLPRHATVTRFRASVDLDSYTPDMGDRDATPGDLIVEENKGKATLRPAWRDGASTTAGHFSCIWTR